MAGEFAVCKSVVVGGKRTRPTKPETREQVIARNISRKAFYAQLSQEAQ